MGNLADGGLAFGVALAAAPAVLWTLRRVQLLDVPTDRSSHLSATPRGGGVAPALGCVAAAVVSTRLAGTSRDAIVVVSICLGLIGLADDLRRRSIRARLLGQLAVASLALFWLVRGLGGGTALRAVAMVAIVIWVVGFVNVFNFMDGINGLAVAQLVVAGLSWWIIGSHERVPALAAAGLIGAAAAIAFAPFNVPHARMFLGDAGSYFLGAWLAVSVVIGLRAGIAPEAVVAPLTVFLADAGITLLRRIHRHEPWSQPHREHAYQRLVMAGWSHIRTSLSVGLAMASVSALGALSLTKMPALRILGDAVAMMVLASYVMLPGRLTGRATWRATGQVSRQGLSGGDPNSG